MAKPKHPSHREEKDSTKPAPLAGINHGEAIIDDPLPEVDQPKAEPKSETPVEKEQVPKAGSKGIEGVPGKFRKLQ